MISVDTMIVIPGPSVIISMDELVKGNETTTVYALNDYRKIIMVNLSNPRKVGVANLTEVVLDDQSFVHLSEDTEVRLVDGTYKAAGALLTTDVLWSTLGSVKVVAAIPKGPGDCYTADFDGGEAILVRGWKRTRQSIAVKFSRTLAAHATVITVSETQPFVIDPGTWLTNIISPI
jgi:hypothetical protein